MRPGPSVAAWLCGIARNHVRRRAERDRLLQPLGDGEPGENDDRVDELMTVDADTLGDLTRAESIDALREAVLTLPVRYREAVVLCDLQEMSYVDAAAATGLRGGNRALAAASRPRAPGGEARRQRADRGRTTGRQPPRRRRAVVSNISRTLRSVRNLA